MVEYSCIEHPHLISKYINLYGWLFMQFWIFHASEEVLSLNYNVIANVANSTSHLFLCYGGLYMSLYGCIHLLFRSEGVQVQPLQIKRNVLIWVDTVRIIDCLAVLSFIYILLISESDRSFKLMNMFRRTS